MLAAAEPGHSLFEFSAEAVTAWAAIIALASAVLTVWAARRQSKEADAQDSFRSYLEVSLNNPDLASPSYEKIKADPEKLEKYNWFVAYLLSASEKILEVAGKDRAWRGTIALNVGYHKALLRDEKEFEDDQLVCYSTPLQEVIAEVSGRRPLPNAEKVESK